MARESEKEVICPYCGHEFSDSWEFNEYANDETDVDCHSCDKKFTLRVDVEVDYSTYRIDCKDDKHKYGEPSASHLDQMIIDDWNFRKFLGRTDWTTHTTWSRDCKNCEHTESKELPLKSENPWPDPQLELIPRNP